MAGRTARPLRRLPPQFTVALWVIAVVGLALLAGYELAASRQSPAAAIRHDLLQAASDIRLPGPAPREAGRRALLRHFSKQHATLDTRSWPAVAITLQGLDRATCVDATSIAGRIEGLVVVQLEGYASAADCGETNTMSWRIMP